VELLEYYSFYPYLSTRCKCKAIAAERLKNDEGRRRDLGPTAAR